MSLRIGVAGLRRGGSICRVFLHHKECTVTAVCDLDAEQARDFAEQNDIPHWFSDYSALCRADLDAIVVATPGPTHVPFTVEALENGKHVLSEVPAVWSLEEGVELERAVRESGLKYMFAENMCYYAWVESYREMIHRGDLGEIIYAEGEYIHNCESLMTLPGHSAENPQLTWRASLPPIQYCTHDLGPILQIMDDRVVTAVGMHTGNRRRPDIGVIDLEVALFKTAKGNIIKQLVSFSTAKEPSHHWFCLYGTEGQIESPRGPKDRHRLCTRHIPNLHEPLELPLSTSHPHAPPEATVGGHGTSEYFMVNDFVRCILDDTPSPIDVYTALDQTLPGICAHMSAEQGSVPVEVPDLRPQEG